MLKKSKVKKIILGAIIVFITIMIIQIIFFSSNTHKFKEDKSVKVEQIND